MRSHTSCVVFLIPNVVHVDGSVDPLRDISVIDTELILADLDTIQKRYNAMEKAARAGTDKKAAAVMGVLTPVKKALEAGNPARSLNLSEEDLLLIHDFHLITAKKVMYVANVDDSDIGKAEPNAYVKKLIDYAKKEGSPVVQICGKIESEIAELSEEEKVSFLKEMGMDEPGLNRVIRAGYELLGLQTYFTARLQFRARLETARVLALRGGKVIGLARTLEKAKSALSRLSGGQTLPLECELSDPKSVRKCIETIRSQSIKIDAIICNAGVMATPTLIRDHGYERQFFTNHIGHFTLVTGLLDSLTPQGRVIMVSSSAHKAAPKAAIEFDNLKGEKVIILGKPTDKQKWPTWFSQKN
ncbi:unnamed protein product [Sphagnum jensenii]|uniref:OBG-type G domain-containing protein n=1 Tax=Sphagnum jensenii TaxID=128206 RepID=A0ABP0V745_9BRYO